MYEEKLRILTEDVITLREAARLLPKRPHHATLWRWANKGVGGIRLESVKQGRDLLTSKQALNRFLRALNADRWEGERC